MQLNRPENRTPNDLLFEQARPLLENTDRSYRSIAAEVGMDERSLRRHVEKKTPHLRRGVINGNTVTSSPTKGRVPTEEDVLREHDIDPDEVVVISGRASRWGNPDDPNYQLRVNYEYPDNLIQIPDPSTWEKPDLGSIEEFSEGIVLFRSDPHMPFNNVALNRAVLRWIDVMGEQVGRIVFLGDLADNSMLSKHRTHPKFKTMLNTTNTAVARHIWETRTAAPRAQIDVIPGNHDARIPYYVMDKAPELEGIRPGLLPDDTEEPNPSLGFRELWRLDDLGVNLVDEDWKLASLPITNALTARHGYMTGNNSEKKMLEKHGRSQVHGHLHRGSVEYRTKHDPLDIRVILDAGTEAQVDPSGLGYEPDPNWTPGIGIAHVWDDGMFKVDFVPFINNYLLFSDGMRISGEE